MDIDSAITEIKELKHQISVKDNLIEKLLLQIHNSDKKLYGPKTEKLSDEQLKLDMFQGQEHQPELELEEKIVIEKHSRIIQRGRKPFADNIPREEITYHPEVTICSCCNAELVKIGEERSEELEKVPEQLKVIVHIRPKLACSQCKDNKVFIAPMPATAFPLEKARPGAGLLADILVSKYVDALPLHRQEEMYFRKGVIIPRQRMSDWVQKSAELLRALYEELRKEILSFCYIQADETTLKVQDGVEKEKCHTGFLWGLLGPPHLIYFHYDKSRSGAVAQKLLEGFEGCVQTDAYAGYNKVYTPNTCKRIACLAHVRRKFIDVQKTAHKESLKVLTLIAKLYKLTPIERREKSTGILNELFEYLLKIKETTLPKAPLMEAINYTLSQREEIFRIFSDDAFHLDNNAIERQMKKIAIGRKNYYFAGSHRGAESAAILYSILGTCKLNNVNPWEWLKDIIIRISSDNTVKTKDLLPHNWKPFTSAKTQLGI